MGTGTSPDDDSPLFSAKGSEPVPIFSRAGEGRGDCSAAWHQLPRAFSRKILPRLLEFHAKLGMFVGWEGRST